MSDLFEEPVAGECHKQNKNDCIPETIEPKTKDLGGFTVNRLLPADTRKMIGPFIFFDHLDYVEFSAGDGVDVRPHPHIGLATITYLFAGYMKHRDSLGNVTIVEPGDINLMIAGSGIVHSERTPEEVRNKSHALHALQLWIALPEENEKDDASFHHYDQDSLPLIYLDGAEIRVLIGELFGKKSPVKQLSKTIYLQIKLKAGSSLSLPSSIAERGLYLIEGRAQLDQHELTPHHMYSLHVGQEIKLTAIEDTNCVLIGGDSLGQRHIEWNFVASKKELIEQAKQKWRDRGFDNVPGETEFIPLPE